MSFITRHLVIFITFLFHLSCLHAADTITLTVLGAHTCKDWNTKRENERKVPQPLLASLSAASSQHWLLGYMSGYNAAYPTNKDLLDGMDADTVTVWMDKYCTSNPTKKLYEAAGVLLRQLVKLSH
jgi:hypothetical protein